MTFEEQAATLKRKEVVALLASHQELAARCAELTSRTEELTRQLDWFKRQLFGAKSERRPTPKAMRTSAHVCTSTGSTPLKVVATD